ncbi:hypothetical protein ACIBJF_42125 [Streptomyces sp. NPDC050743]|uniref:hypothetical protein n=1 Tax=Streptomyces sp. NPDC050743 TaxID=3365634 RepID=UPI00378A5664
MAATPERGHKLTAKSLAPRERIIEAAAQLISEHGVQNTNNKQTERSPGERGSAAPSPPRATYGSAT